MTFAALKSAPVDRAIEALAKAEQLTVIAGVGVSREAGLPDWGELVKRLLRRLARDRLGDDSEAERWVDQTVDRDQNLGAAAVVAALKTSETLGHWISTELYHGEGPNAFAPGPIGVSLAHLVGAFEKRIRIITLNYDDLLERALTVPRSSMKLCGR